MKITHPEKIPQGFWTAPILEKYLEVWPFNDRDSIGTTVHRRVARDELTYETSILVRRGSNTLNVILRTCEDLQDFDYVLDQIKELKSSLQTFKKGVEKAREEMEKVIEGEK